MKKSQKGNLRKRKITSVFVYLLYIVILVLFFLTKYIFVAFPDVTFEQLLFSVQTADGTSDSMIVDGVKYIVPRVLFVLFVFYILKLILLHFFKTSQVLIFKIKNKKFRIDLVPLSNVIRILFALLFLSLSVYYCFKQIGIINYYTNNSDSKYIVTNYIDPKKVKIKAPSEKQNLIFIYVESLESTFFSNKNGGDFQDSVIPNLEKIALENTSFSNRDILGGAYTPYGTTWTIAGMVGSTSGIPLKLPIGDNDYHGYGSFLPGAYSLGDILKDNGYENYLFIGSDATFGGRKDYFTYHGNFTIYDYYTAKEKKWIDSNYHEWWGFEDKKLYEFAKETLTEISKKDKPFNFTMLTADTHATDGYVDKSCEQPFDEKYLNAYNCTDTMIAKFIDWIKKQKFYKNTTIVIVGDHLSMQGNLPNMYDVSQEYSRKTYNVFINSVANTDNNKNRNFTTFDYYPTTLASLGFEIEGERLGLGTNLYSSKKTLLEEYDFEKMNEELSKKSSFYNDKLLQID